MAVKQKLKATCPYTVRAAQSIWMEGLREGVRLAMEYAGTDKTLPQAGKDIKITFPERGSAADAMGVAIKW